MNSALKLAILGVAFGAATAVASAALQKEGDKPAYKPQDKPAGSPVDASVPTPRAPMSIPLAGVTEDNAARVETALRAILRTSYECKACGTSQPIKGQCPKCNAELAATTAAAIKEVEVDAAKGSMLVTLQPGQQVALTEIERTLGADGVKVDRSMLAIPSFARLQIAATGDPKTVEKAIEKALVGSKLFGAARVRHDEALASFAVTVERPDAVATHGEAVEALAKVSKDMRLTDVAWIGPCPSCAKSGNLQAGCGSCWPASAEKAAAEKPRGPKG
jgi:hypothetical protein